MSWFRPYTKSIVVTGEQIRESELAQLLNCRPGGIIEVLNLDGPPFSMLATRSHCQHCGASALDGCGLHGNFHQACATEALLEAE